MSYIPVNVTFNDNNVRPSLSKMTTAVGLVHSAGWSVSMEVADKADLGSMFSAF